MITKKASILAAASLALAGIAGAAHAVPATWTDSYDAPGAYETVTTSSPLTFSFDITDVGSGSYHPGVDILSSLVFSFNIADDSESLFTYETGKIFIDVVNDSGSKTATFSSTIWGTLDAVDPITINTQLTQWDTGKYDITISAENGDFNVIGASLLASGSTGTVAPPTSVPEPTSLALIGLSLLGAGAAARRKKK